jgi:hypothetical protein
MVTSSKRPDQAPKAAPRVTRRFAQQSRHFGSSAIGHWQALHLMHHGRFLALILLAAAAWVSGCATGKPASKSKPAIMIAVRLAGGGMPSPRQAAAVQQAMAPAADRAGLQFASSLDTADFLVTVSFIPDPEDPAKGEIKVNRVERTPKNLGGGSGGDDPKQAIRALEQWGEKMSAPMY